MSQEHAKFWGMVNNKRIPGLTASKTVSIVLPSASPTTTRHSPATLTHGWRDQWESARPSKYSVSVPFSIHTTELSLWHSLNSFTFPVPFRRQSSAFPYHLQAWLCSSWNHRCPYCNHIVPFFFSSLLGWIPRRWILEFHPTVPYWKCSAIVKTTSCHSSTASRLLKATWHSASHIVALSEQCTDLVAAK